MTQKYKSPTYLYVTKIPPISKSPAGTKWADVAGFKIRNIFQYDDADRCYLARFSDGKETWVPEDWIEEIVGIDALRQAWRDESFSEANRQIKVAKAFQNLLWREMMGRAIKKKVGDRVTIKRSADTILRAFPSSWIEDTHPLCYGLSGTIDIEIREMGVDGEMYRGYRVVFQLSPDERVYVWFTGDDLESS